MAMPRKRPFANPQQMYVYTWKYQGKVVYVGFGGNNRGRPSCSSGWSGKPQELIQILRDDVAQVIPTYYRCTSKEHAISLESKLIAFFKPRFNKSPGQGGYVGMHTEEGRRRLSELATGRPVSDEVREGRRQRMLGNQQLLGHRHSDETKQKISAKSKGKTLSDLGRRKASERMKERHRLGLCPSRKGAKLSDETRAKLRAARKAYFDRKKHEG